MKKLVFPLIVFLIFVLCLPLYASGNDVLVTVEPTSMTFVSAEHPDNTFSNSNNMLISGGDDANILFISFETSCLADLGYVLLNINVGNDSATMTEVYLLDNYLVDESTLTYNTMPELDSEKIIGQYALAAGDNKVELSSVLDKVSGEYFTLVFKSTDTDVHSYYVDFESIDSVSASNASVTVDDVEYFYGYSDDYFNRYGGSFGKSTLSVIKDPVDGLNKILEVSSGGTGRIKLYNALSHDALEESDFDKTYRFCFRVKDGNADVGNLRYGIMPASGTQWSYADSVLKSDVNDEGWTDISYDLKLSETFVTVDTVNDPMFTINMVGDNYLDQIYVAQLDGNGKERLAIIDSQSGIAALIYDAALPVAASYTSSTNPDKAYIGKDIAVGNSNSDSKIAFVSYVNTAIHLKNSLLLKIPDSVGGLSGAEVFLLPNYLVDESKLTYNTMPYYGDIFVGKYDIKGGEGVDISHIADKITGTYFTLVIRSDYHAYSENFENMTSIEKAASPTLGYSDTYFYSVGGRTSNLSVSEISGTKALYAKTNTTSYTGRYKFFNTLTADEITAADVGKTYRFSLNILAASNTEDDVPDAGNKVVVGVIPASGTTIYENGKVEYKQLSESDWTELVSEYTIAESDVGTQLMFTVQFTKASTSPLIHYYMDDFKAVEIVNGEAATPSEDVTFFEDEMLIVDGVLDNMKAVDIDGKVTSFEITVNNTAVGTSGMVTDVLRIAGKGFNHSLLGMDSDSGELFFTENGEKIYLCNSLGVRYTANGQSIKIQTIYDDNSGCIRFAVGNSLAYCENGKITDCHMVIDGGISGDAYIGVYDAENLVYNDIVCTEMAKDCHEVVGFQIAEITDSVRILAGIDSLCYSKYGFKIDYLVNGQIVNTEKIDGTNKLVYTSVIADDKPITAKSLGTTYLACLVINDIKEGGIINVTPYTIVGDNIHNGKTVTYEIKNQNGLEMTERVSLDGKKIIFFGQSHVYYGNTVLETGTSVLTQEERTGDEGYFYQLCKANGENVTVTNFTFGNHGLTDFVSGSCAANRGCNGVDHISYLKDKYFDYVIMGVGSGERSETNFRSDIETMMHVFRTANSNVKFAILVPASLHGVRTDGVTYPKLLADLKWAEEQGCIIVDWGGVVKGILDGSLEIPNSQFAYNQNSFIVSKSSSDGYHPNQLSGYITTLMTYAAITNKPASGQSYAFCGDGSLCDHSAYRTFDEFNAKYYTYGDKTTNYAEIFASESEMAGIQTAIDNFLEAKSYKNYTYTETE